MLVISDEVIFTVVLVHTTVEVVQCMWSPDSVLGRSDTVILTVRKFGQAFCRTKNVLKFNFDYFRGSFMLVDSCFNAGKIR